MQTMSTGSKTTINYNLMIMVHTTICQVCSITTEVNYLTDKFPCLATFCYRTQRRQRTSTQRTQYKIQVSKYICNIKHNLSHTFNIKHYFPLNIKHNLVLCRSLLVILSFFFWSLCCLSSFDLRIIITPLVSANTSHHMYLI